MATKKSAYYSVSVPCVLGAICADANPDIVNALQDFGLNLGLAFQIQDDLLNLVDDTNANKDFRNDITEGKRTLIVCKAIETSKDKDEVNETNFKAVRNLVDTLEKNGCRHMADYPNQCCKNGYKDVPLDYIQDFLRNIEVLKVNGCFDPDFLRQYLAEYSGEELKKWDIAFVSGSSNQTIDFVS